MCARAYACVWRAYVCLIKAALSSILTDLLDLVLPEEGILRDTDRIEDGIRTVNSPLIVASASNIARRANRVLQVAEMEAQNSEDPHFVDRVNEASENLKASQ